MAALLCSRYAHCDRPQQQLERSGLPRIPWADCDNSESSVAEAAGSGSECVILLILSSFGRLGKSFHLVGVLACFIGVRIASSANVVSVWGRG